MKMHYRLQAMADIERIRGYIENDNPHVATDVVVRIHQTARFLTLFPRIGRRGTIPNTYELLVRGLPYMIVYEMDHRDKVTILAIFHCARER